MESDPDMTAASAAIASADGPVALVGPGARVRVGASERFFFDAAHQHVVVQRRSSFHALPLDARGRAPARGVLVGPAPAILARLSLDGSLLAVQTSATTVVVAEADGTRRWRIEVRGGGGGAATSVAGFLERMVVDAAGGAARDAATLVEGGLVWTDHGGTSQDLVLVTTRGAELYKVSCARGQCRLVRSLAYATAWFAYAPAARLLALGTGGVGRVLRPYWLRREVSDLPKFELPPPEKVRKLELAGSGPLRRADVDLLVLGGAPCLVVHAPGGLAVYAVRKERCERLVAIDAAFAGPRFLTTDDDLLFVHFRRARTTVFYDFADGAARAAPSEGKGQGPCPST